MFCFPVFIELNTNFPLKTVPLVTSQIDRTVLTLLSKKKQRVILFPLFDGLLTKRQQTQEYNESAVNEQQKIKNLSIG